MRNVNICMNVVLNKRKHSLSEKTKNIALHGKNEAHEKLPSQLPGVL